MKLLPILLATAAALSATGSLAQPATGATGTGCEAKPEAQCKGRADKIADREGKLREAQAQLQTLKGAH